MVLETFRLDGKNALVTGSSRGSGRGDRDCPGARPGRTLAVMVEALTGESYQRTRSVELGRKSFYLAGDMAEPELVRL